MITIITAKKFSGKTDTASVRIRSSSGPYSPAFGIKTERYGVVVSPTAGKYRPE